jgi:phosphohistidine swiveling domain-containing protein
LSEATKGEPVGWASEFDTTPHPETVWTSANVQEVIPGLLSPMSWSLISDVLDQARLRALRRVGITISNPDPFIGLFYGRPFLNVSFLREAAEKASGHEGIDEQYLGVARDANATTRRRSFGQRLVEEAAALEAAHPISELSTEELTAVIKLGRTVSGPHATVHFSTSSAAGVAFERLRQRTAQWLGDGTGALHATLCSGLSSVESARPAFELWDLSRIALASPALRQAFAATDGAEIESGLRALDDGVAGPFRERLAAFLRRHGYRAVMEGDLSSPTWADDVPSVLMMVRNYVGADAASDPHLAEERQRREREAAEKDALKRVGWRRRAAFRWALAEARRTLALREQSKSLLVRANDRLRRLMRELGHRLVADGRLAQVEDIFFLTWEEAVGLAEGNFDASEAAAAVHRRRAEGERNRNLVLPESFSGRPRPLSAAPASTKGQVLRGIAVSPGRATGPARVVRDPRDNAEVKKGEILVAPVTDAAWTPLFVTVAGLVVDVGGTLSHGSIVAREYGLPAVVGVKTATQCIRTGQTITVDGSQGIVIVED